MEKTNKDIFIDKIIDFFTSTWGSFIGVVFGFYLVKDTFNKKVNEILTLIFAKNIALSAFQIFTFFFILSSIIFLIFTFYKRKSKNKVILEEHQFDYEAITEDNYIYISKNIHRFERKIKIKALKDNVKHFDFFMKWTGEKYNVDALIHSQKIIPIKVGKIDFDTYHLMIPNVLKKNDTCDIHIVFTCENYLQLANSYFSKTIRYPIEKLNIIVFFDSSVSVKTVLQTQDKFWGSPNPKDSKINYLNGATDFKLPTLENPIVGECWTLSWE